LPFSNLDYLFDHLPARFRRDEAGELLKRFLTFVGETLDGWDSSFANFHQQIAPGTAAEEFIDWWLLALFGWAWFPSWYTLAEKRTFYGQVATLYAQRGTRTGIQNLLAAFGVHLRAYTSPAYWGLAFFGLDRWALNEPLVIVADVLWVDDRVNAGACFWGDSFWGSVEAITTAETLSKSEIEMLLKFEQPFSQVMAVNYN